MDRGVQIWFGLRSRASPRERRGWVSVESEAAGFALNQADTHSYETRRHRGAGCKSGKPHSRPERVPIEAAVEIQTSEWDEVVYAERGWHVSKRAVHRVRSTRRGAFCSRRRSLHINGAWRVAFAPRLGCSSEPRTSSLSLALRERG
eukprot:4844021-Pleurochrysis_carterae.AAC.1